MRTINLKEDEIRFMQKDLIGWKEATENGTQENQRLQDIIGELEDKNRAMNDKLNEVIYNKASAYKQRTLNALKMTSSPERQRRAAEYGFSNVVDKRIE